MNRDPFLLRRPTVGVVIRFRNSATTLPAVLSSLKTQTRQPDMIIGVDNGSTDNSAELVRAAGGRVLDWNERYTHPRVLNHGITHCPTTYVMALSSHTTLDAPDVIERLVNELDQDPQACAVSAPWDGDSFYSRRVTWEELKEKGLKFGGIYSNSMGMIRRSCWERRSFDPRQVECEDYAWAVEMLDLGHVVLRVPFPFSYHRHGGNRIGIFASVAFDLARRHGLRVAWLGPWGSLRGLAHHAWRWMITPTRQSIEKQALSAHWAKLSAWLRAAF